MKIPRILLSAATAAALLFTPVLSRADDDPILYALGATGTQSVLVTYFAVNSLGDAYSKKMYDKEQAVQVLAIYQSATKTGKESLEKALSAKLTEADKDALKSIADTYAILLDQCAALEKYIESGDDEAAAEFEANRKKAQAAIDKMMN